MLNARSIGTLLLGIWCLLCTCPKSFCQTDSPALEGKAAQLKFVVILSRHGVRSPTSDASRYGIYSRAAWPQWDVPPGYLTTHGFELMKILGSYDRSLLAQEGLLSGSGCANADQTYFYADSDQRTRESGRALAEGMFPGCDPIVHGLPEGAPDPLFHPRHAMSKTAVSASVADPAPSNFAAQALFERYRPQIADMDHILATCGAPALRKQSRVSLLEVPARPRAGKSARPGELNGPLEVAASLSENFLLEYVQGMPLRDVGWGCINESTLRSLIALHTAAFDYTHRNPIAARRDASNLLNSIHAAMQQAVTGARVSGAPNPPGARALFLIGHDTNLASVAALLHLNWAADGRRDDTPPGSALVFELWRERTSGQYFVRIFYTAQTLDQMRNTVILTLEHPPLRIPLAVSGCSAAEGHLCTWAEFTHNVNAAIDPAFLVPLR